MIDWKAALDSFFGEHNWDENGMPPKDGPRGWDPYQGASVIRHGPRTRDPVTSAGLPTLGKRS